MLHFCIWTQILIYHFTVFLLCLGTQCFRKHWAIMFCFQIFPLGPPLWEPNFHAVICSLTIEQPYVNTKTEAKLAVIHCHTREESAWIFQPKAFTVDGLAATTLVAHEISSKYCYSSRTFLISNQIISLLKLNYFWGNLLCNHEQPEHQVL